MRRKEAGQTIIEAVFLIGVTFLLLAGLVTSVIFSIKASRYSKNKAIAARIAREQIEAIKAGKQTPAFWDPVSFSVGVIFPDCPDVSIPSNFGCEYIYVDRRDSGDKSQVELRIISWWDSATAPTNWWNFGVVTSTRKNNVILTTIISNWEQ